jgi:UDP-N-acetylglucosamine 2-epimerase (non-hydrolysing)
MKQRRVLNIVGARPNFMKMAPILRELARQPFESYLVHTGQHYDETMSRVFFQDLKMPDPEFNLEVGSGTHAVQTARIMERFDEVCRTVQPNLVIVAGDVNSTLACALTAAKLQIPVAHIEAGLRSFDRSMPEEINRIVTDSVSDFLFTSEESGNRNLRCEGVAEDKIHFVGNTMIDSLIYCRSRLDDETPQKWAFPVFDGTPYLLATIHRPANVDCSGQLWRVVQVLEYASEFAPIFFVTHPRTLKQLQRVQVSERFIDLKRSTRQIRAGFIYLLPPLPYLDFLRLMANSKAVLTDSGGIQEETTFLGIPCLTLRDNTERPSTVEFGTNEIVALNCDKIVSYVNQILSGYRKKAVIPPLWDGRAAERVMGVLMNSFGLA